MKNKLELISISSVLSDGMAYGTSYVFVQILMNADEFSLVV